MSEAPTEIPRRCRWEFHRWGRWTTEQGSIIWLGHAPVPTTVQTRECIDCGKVEIT